MKNLSILACLLACLLAFSGCDKEQVPVDCDTARSSSRSSNKAVICYHGHPKQISAHYLCHYIDKGAVQLIDNDGDGYVTEANDCGIPVDCDDTNPDFTDNCTVDNDGDGFTDDVDCDDNNAEINPGATEEPYNGIDDDCDASTPDDDLDGDGFNLADDCDDTDATLNDVCSTCVIADYLDGLGEKQSITCIGTYQNKPNSAFYAIRFDNDQARGVIALILEMDDNKLYAGESYVCL